MTTTTTTTTRRTVLLIHADGERRARVRQWLGEATVIEVGSRHEALEVLHTFSPSLVVSEPTDFQKLLRDLERHAPAAKRAVLCPANGAARAVKATLVGIAAQGYDFTTVDESAPHEVQGLLSTRASARIEPRSPLKASFTVDGVTVHAAVVELGNDGIGLSVRPDAPPALFEPHARLLDARVMSPAGAVTESKTWTTRAVHHDSTGQLHVGVAFEVPARPEPRAPRVTDTVQISGWLQRATLRSRPFELHTTDGSSRSVFQRAEFDPATGRLTLASGTPVAAWVEGDAVVVSFRNGPMHTECTTTILSVESDRLTLCRPRSAVQRERRGSLRMTFDGSVGGPTLEFSSPLGGGRRPRRLLDLTATGAAFEFDAHAEAFPPGLLLGECVLEIEGRKIAVSAVVVGSVPLGAGSRRRCGVRLEGICDADRTYLIDALAAFIVPETKGSSEVPFERVWGLFVHEHAQFPDYPLDEPATLESLSVVQSKLNRAPGLGRSFAFQVDGEVVGHSAGLRCYSGTWLSMHLMLRAGYHRAEAMAQALVNLSFDYGEAMQDVEYIRGLWRLGNRWTNRVYGGGTPRLVHAGKSYLLTVIPMRRSVAPLPPGPYRAHGTREVKDLLEVLQSTVDPVKLASDDITAHELFMPSLELRYRHAGLARGRSVGVVEVGGRPRGWVLVEDMTDGLIFLNLFTRHTFVLAEPGAADAPEVIRALAAYALGEHATRGHLHCTAIASPDQVPTLEALGYVSHLGPLVEFCAHRSMTREVTAELLTVFERLAVRTSLRRGKERP